MMPSLDHCVNNPSEMTTLTKTLEVFDTYKERDDKDSDEESFHLPLDDDEVEPSKETDLEEPLKNGIGSETEDDILNKFDNGLPNVDQVDPCLEETLLNEDVEEKNKTEDRSNSGLGEIVSEKCENEYCLNENEENNSDTSDEQNKVANGTIVEHEKDCLEEVRVATEKECNFIRVNEYDAECLDENDETKKCDAEIIVKQNTTSAIENINESSGGNFEDDGDDVKASEEKNDINIQANVVNGSGNTKGQKLNKESLPADDNAIMGDSCHDTDQAENQTKSADSNSNKCGDDISEKCDSNDSTKQHNEDSEDLFDISVIRDAEEDNAENAYNEAHQEENNVQEDYDDRGDEKMDEDSCTDKTNNLEEDEEMDIDKHEEHLKNDDVEIEEENLKIDGDNDEVKDTVCDSGDCENKTDVVQINNEQNISESLPSKEKDARAVGKIQGTIICSDSVEKGTEVESTEKTSCATRDPDEENKDLETRKFLKRPLQEDEDVGSTKKMRTENADMEGKDEVKPKEKLPLKTLLSLSEFMITKKNNKRLTIHDLEEFCVQKICEAIVHKSELGDVHHQLKLQEQLIETMRKEIQQLTKQTRDLEIVNKKLMSDLKQQTATQKPLNPLKITRSVGLQVKFTPSFDANMKRRQSNAVIGATTALPQSSSTTAAAATAAAATATNQKAQPPTPNRNCRIIPNTTTTSVNRQISSPQKQQQQQIPKPNTPLLSQALQNRRSVNDVNNKVTNQPIRPKPVEHKTGTPSSSVIDLTDEDDKKDKNKNSPSKMVTTKSITTVPLRTTPVRVNATTQGIRLTTSQGKGSPITSVVTSSAPQVMYVVQSSPQNVLTSPLGPKAVVVNFQSANGVLTSALNGSAVSVIPKQGNTIQLKTVAPSKQLPNNKLVKLPNKHPAPLPTPPVVRTNSEKPLKPIPPKPHLTIRKTDTGIILQWKMPYELDNYEVIASYQLYAYQETSAMPSTDMWRKVGDVKALALPMACTLTQFADKNKYYFAVRPVDIHKRIGMFSDPEEISL